MKLLLYYHRAGDASDEKILKFSKFSVFDIWYMFNNTLLKTYILKHQILHLIHTYNHQNILVTYCCYYTFVVFGPGTLSEQVMLSLLAQ